VAEAPATAPEPWEAGEGGGAAPGASASGSIPLARAVNRRPPALPLPSHPQARVLLERRRHVGLPGSAHRCVRRLVLVSRFVFSFFFFPPSGAGLGLGEE